jgi:hypothetical protein
MEIRQRDDGSVCAYVTTAFIASFEAGVTLGELNEFMCRTRGEHLTKDTGALSYMWVFGAPPDLRGPLQVGIYLLNGDVHRASTLLR